MFLRKPSDSGERDSISFSEAFKNEIKVIEAARAKRQIPSNRRPIQNDLIGLSFSGGGIRSATFNLGVIQALARRHLLVFMDYLSTVSGGGYIGSWLTSWAYHTGQRDGLDRNHIRQIEEELNRAAHAIGDEAEVPQILFLRKYSNYLTPRLGTLSGDTLAFVSTYTRNLVLNQIILIAALLSLLLVPRAVGLTFYKFNSGVSIEVCTLVALILLGTVFGQVLANVRSHRPYDATRVTFAVALPIFVFCLVAAYLFWQLVFEGVLSPPIDRSHQFLIVALTALVYTGLWVIATVLIRHREFSFSDRIGDTHRSIAYLRWAPALWALPAGVVAGLFILLGSNLLQRLVDRNPNDGGWRDLVAFGVPVTTAFFLLVGIVHLGLIGSTYEDGLREWWARLGGVVFGIAACWFLLSLVTLFIPRWLGTVAEFLGNSDRTWATQVWKVLSALGIASVLAGWITATLAGLLAAKGTQTGPQPHASATPGKFADLAARLAPPIFAAGLVLVLSVLLYFAMPIGSTRWRTVIFMALGLFALSVFFGFRIDVNEFSLHNAYRNRLVRCYLGATNPNRKPQPFTGFDESDNIYLDSLLRLAAPFHIVNATLNVMRGRDLALQARKARPFVFTPLYSGFAYTAESKEEGDMASYRLSKNCSLKSRYPGIRLGTAMAISGAAASPNMGHYTTGAVAFLLTVFSVRLGWWLGNPMYKKCWESGRPRSSWRALINELTGNTNDLQKEVYLSDGGHFENLGIYELVRRRCRLIIASDAGADPKCVCNDLASAIEKCRVDFGTEIEVELDHIRPGVRLLPGDETLRASKHPFTIGNIRYPDGREGTLIYIKSSLNTRLPQDLLAYARLATDFPHQSTIDQFFDETQFESYRALGFACASAAIEEIRDAILNAP